MIKLEALLTCDDCGEPVMWGQTNKEEPQYRFTCGQVATWARQEGWLISKTRHLCPECRND